MGLFDHCVDPNLLVRRITVVANHIISENDIPADKDADQPDLFTDYEALEKQRAAEQAELDKEKRLQQRRSSASKTGWGRTPSRKTRTSWRARPEKNETNRSAVIGSDLRFL